MDAPQLQIRPTGFLGRYASNVGRFLPRLVLALPYTATILLVGLNFRLIGDEGFFHLKVIASFADTWPQLWLGLADYPSASTPLPYLIWTLYGKLVGFEVWELRLLAVLAAFAATNPFYDLCKRRNMPHPLLSALIFLFFPYTFFHAFTVYTVSFGLLFGVWALQYYLRETATPGSLLRASLLATLAIYCRQYYIALPLGMLAYRVLQPAYGRFLHWKRQDLLGYVLLSLPLWAIIPLFWLWGGLTPPSHQHDHFICLVPEHLNFPPIFIGSYFLPALLDVWASRTFRTKAMVGIALLIPLYLAFMPVYSEEIGRVAAATGLIVHGLDLLSGVWASLPAVSQFALWGIGCLILALLITGPISGEKAKLLACLAAFLVMITFTPYVSERYYLLTVPLLILLTHRLPYHGRLLLWWLLIQIGLSAGFTYWQIMLKLPWRGMSK